MSTKPEAKQPAVARVYFRERVYIGKDVFESFPGSDIAATPAKLAEFKVEETPSGIAFARTVKRGDQVVTHRTFVPSSNVACVCYED